jgi:hypothetical protein
MQSKKARIYLTVTALAITGLIVDRLILPNSSSAEVPLVTRPVRGGAPTSGSASPELATNAACVPELPFPRNLPSWSPDDPIRDIFLPNASTASSDNRLRQAGDHDADGHATVAALQRDHHLDAILVNERLRIAVIGGRRVGIGQEAGGCQIVAVEGTHVRFRCRDGECVLTLQPNITPSRD